MAPIDLSGFTTEQLDALERASKQQRTLIATAEKEVAPAIETLRKYSTALSTEQRNEILGIVQPKGTKTGKSTAPRDRTPAPAKYQLPTGETWSGRGRNVPPAFQAWVDSPAGQKWQQENPAQKYPPVKK